MALWPMCPVPQQLVRMSLSLRRTEDGLAHEILRQETMIAQSTLAGRILQSCSNLGGMKKTGPDFRQARAEVLEFRAEARR